MRRYVMRCRCDAPLGRVALIVDEYGTAHLFREGQLRDHLAGEDASPRVAHRLADHDAWVPVPQVRPYTIGNIRRLTARSAAHELARSKLAAAPVGWRRPAAEAPPAAHQAHAA